MGRAIEEGIRIFLDAKKKLTTTSYIYIKKITIIKVFSINIALIPHIILFYRIWMLESKGQLKDRKTEEKQE